MLRKNKKKNTFVAENACSSHFFVICTRFQGKRVLERCSSG